MEEDSLGRQASTHLLEHPSLAIALSDSLTAGSKDSLGSGQQELSGKPSIRDSPVWLLFARWSVVMHWDALALSALYTDFAVLKIRENPEAWDIRGKAPAQTVLPLVSGLIPGQQCTARPPRLISHSMQLLVKSVPA